MPRMSRFLATIAICACAALGLAACGGGDAELLPGDTAENISRNLDLVEELADAGDCIGAEEATAEVADQIEELQVDSQLQAALSDGVELLSSIVAECQEAEVEEEPEETLEPLEETEAAEEEPRDGGDEREREETQPREETRPEPTTPSEEEGGESEEPAPSEEEDPSGGLGPGEPAGSE